jgi:putative oxidoreductase
MDSMFTKIIRIALAILLIIFGANKFLHFIPLQPMVGSAGDFMNSLGATGYIFPIVGIIEVFVGIMLLLRKWIPFVLIVLAPISLNILLFHLFLDIPGVGAALLVAVLNATLIYKNWRSYNALFI